MRTNIFKSEVNLVKTILLVTFVFLVQALYAGNDNKGFFTNKQGFDAKAWVISKASIIGSYPQFNSPEYKTDKAYYEAGLAMRENKDNNEAYQAIVNQAWDNDMGCNSENLAKYFSEKANLGNIDNERKEILAECLADAYLINEYAKQYFHRPRPWFTFWGDGYLDDKGNEIYQGYKGDKTLWKHIYGEDSNQFRSYPSGHSTTSYVAALCLCSLYPEKAADILKAANDFTMSRVVLGIHHKSDIDAAYRLACCIFEEIRNTSGFKAKLSNRVKAHFFMPKTNDTTTCFEGKLQEASEKVQ